MSSTGRTPWDVLGIAEDASFSDIKRAYFRRARTAHPDAPGGDAEGFRQVQAAFEELSRRATRPDPPPDRSRRDRVPAKARSARAAGPARAAGTARPERSGEPPRAERTGVPGRAAGAGPEPQTGDRRTPYDRWSSWSRPSRQWRDDDPLLADLVPPPRSRRPTFAEFLAAEMRPGAAAWLREAIKRA
ncbi:MAG: J domain-containing protein [Acidobacteriota bacterium]|nr:J domain-containing protein [Acidobacteriota bacterium]